MKKLILIAFILTSFSVEAQITRALTSKDSLTLATNTNTRAKRDSVLPLTGTVIGKDLTGTVMFNNSGNAYTALSSIQGYMNIGSGNNKDIGISNTKAFTTYNYGGGFPTVEVGVRAVNSPNVTETKLILQGANILVRSFDNSSPSFRGKGLVGQNSFSAQYRNDSLAYVQNGYVKSLVRDSSLILTTNFTSGAATFDINTRILNIPNYAGGSVLNLATANLKQTAPRRYNADSYPLIFDSAVDVSYVDTTEGLNRGHSYKFKKGVEFISYDSANLVAYEQTKLGGIKLTKDNNNIWLRASGLEINAKVFYPQTITPNGTTSLQVINKQSGRVNVAAGQTSVQVNNNLVTTLSEVLTSLRGNDATALIRSVAVVNGSFTIFFQTAPTSEVAVGFLIIN